jgi:Prokaryotic dksA/traR C4-type zinc finger
MSTEWPTDADDDAGPGDDAPPGGEGAPSPEWKAGRSEAEVGADGEGAMHRSAVDAVDGLLDEVELALARLDDGTYGRCEECGEAIDDGRLAALPIIRTCLDCDPEDGTGTVGPRGAPVAESGIVGPAEPAVY